MVEQVIRALAARVATKVTNAWEPHCWIGGPSALCEIFDEEAGVWENFLRMSIGAFYCNQPSGQSPLQFSCNTGESNEEDQTHNRTNHPHLREADTGLSDEELCRKHGISSQTFYRWRDK